MARKYWSHSRPLGSQIKIGEGIGPEFADLPRQIVGIVGDAHEDGLGQPPPPAIYLPVAQVPDTETALLAEISPLHWMIRTKKGQSVDPTIIENKLAEVSGGLPVGKVLPMHTILWHSTARTDFTTLLLMIFGVSALLLAAIGMYGIMAYSVEDRTQEIGIRMALGANRK